MTEARRQLVLNADDAGFGTEGDTRILRALSCGWLRSVSLAVTGETAQDFLQRFSALSLAHRVGVGLHLDFVDGQLLGGPYRTLGQDRGNKERFWRRAADDAVDPDEVAHEARLQWERLCSWGVQPDHLDGHTHVQVFAPVLEGLLRGLGDVPVHLRFPAVPRNGAPGVPAFPSPILNRAQFDEQRRRSRWPQATAFRGFAFSARPQLEEFDQFAPQPGDDEDAMASRRPLEVMVHFGGWAERPFLAAPQRERELELLCDPSTGAHLEGLGFDLVSFGDLL